MARYRLQGSALTTIGGAVRVVPGATITFTAKGASAPATLYESNTGTSNYGTSVTADENGQYDVYVEYSEYYDAEFTVGSRTVDERFYLDPSEAVLEAKDDTFAARDKAEQWANEDEDVAVENGEYSAKHWSKKAQAIVVSSVESVIDDTISDAKKAFDGRALTKAELIASPDVVVGQSIDVLEVGRVILVPASTYTANGSTVIDLTGSGLQAVLAPGEALADRDAIKNDTRPASWFTPNQFLRTRKEGYVYQYVSSGAALTTEGNVGLNVVQGKEGWHFDAFWPDTTGVADVTSAFDAAVSAVNALGGGTLLMPSTYLFATIGTLGATTENIKLDGQHSGVLKTGASGTFDGLITDQGKSNTITGFTFSCDEASVSKIGVELTGCSDSTVIHNRFEGFRYAVLGRTNAVRCTAERNFYNSGSNGATGFVLNGEGCITKGNVIEQFSDTGCGCSSGAKNILITGNYMKSRASSGSLGIIVEESVENVTVSDNIIDGSGGLVTGIKINDNNTGTCPKGVAVYGNIITDVATYGIFTINSGATRDVTDLLMHSNQVINAGTDAYRFSDIASGEIYGNLAEGAGRFGFYSLGNVDGVTFEQNIARNCVDTGFALRNVTNSTIKLNRASGNGTDYKISPPLETTVIEENDGFGSGLREGKQQTISFYGNVGAGTTSGYFHLDTVPDDASIYIDEVQVYEDGSTSTSANLTFETNSSLTGALAGSVAHSPGREVRFQPIAFESNTAGSERYVRFFVRNNDGSNAHDAICYVKYRICGG